MNKNLPNLANFPGIRLYIEDPKLAIKRQIKRTIYIALASLVIGGLILLWVVSSIKKSGAGLAAKEQTINNSLQEQGVEPASENLYQEILPFIEQIKNALPSSTDLLSYQGRLEEAAKSAGVQISVLFSSQEKAPTNLPGSNSAPKTSSVVHQVEVKGSPENIIQFIQNLENLPYYVQVSSFKISTPQGEDKDSSGTLSLKVFTSPTTAAVSPSPSNSTTSLP